MNVRNIGRDIKGKVRDRGRVGIKVRVRVRVVLLPRIHYDTQHILSWISKIKS